MVSPISEIQKSPFFPMRKEWTCFLTSDSSLIGSKIEKINKTFMNFHNLELAKPTSYVKSSILFSKYLLVKFLYFYINRIQLVNVPTRFFANLISTETVSWMRMNLLKAVWMTATS